MLNELVELNEYFDSKSERLIPSLFKWDKCVGIRRPLVMIARFFLFNVFHYDNASSQKEREQIRKDVFAILFSWCSFTCDENYMYEITGDAQEKIKSETKKYKSQIANICEIKKWDSWTGWLKAYVNKSNKSKSFDAKWKAFEHKKKISWCNNDIYKNLAGDRNTVYAISLDRIIAEAIQKKELNDWVLLCDSEYIYHIKKRKNNEVTRYDYIDDFLKPLKNVVKSEKHIYETRIYARTSTKSEEKEKQRILKMIAAYLLEKEYAGRNDTDAYLSVNKTDLANWMNFPSHATSSHPVEYFYDDDPLFEYDGNNMRVNPDFLADFGFRLVRSSDIKDVLKTLDSTKEYIYYTDKGAGEESLVENQ